MSLGAFVSLEDISEALPPYQEEVVGVQMDPPLKQAYEELEEQIKKALMEHRGNPSVISTALNALLLFPDRPFGLGDLYGFDYNPETQQREKFLIAETKDLEESFVYAKEQKLVEEVKAEPQVRAPLPDLCCLYPEARRAGAAHGYYGLMQDGTDVNGLSAPPVRMQLNEPYSRAQVCLGRRLCAKGTIAARGYQDDDEYLHTSRRSGQAESHPKTDEEVVEGLKWYEVVLA